MKNYICKLPNYSYNKKRNNSCVFYFYQYGKTKEIHRKEGKIMRQKKRKWLHLVLASSLLFWSQMAWANVAFASATPNRNVILDNVASDYSSFTTVKRSDGKWLIAYIENYNKVKVSVVNSENDFLTKTNEVQKNATDLLTVTGNLAGSTPYDNLRLYQTKSGKLFLFVQEYGDGVTKPYTLKVYESQNKLGTDFTYKQTIFTGQVMAGPILGRITASIGNPVELANGRLLVPVSQPKMLLSGGAHLYQQMIHTVYTDDGENWNTVEITTNPTTYAHPKGIAVQSDGIYLMTGHSSTSKDTAFYVSRDNGVTWTGPISYGGTKYSETPMSYVIHGSDGNNYMAFGENGKYKLYKRSDGLPLPNDADFFKMGTPIDPTLSGSATWEYMTEWSVEGPLENLYNIGNRLFSVFSWNNTVTGKKYVVTQDIMPTVPVDTTPPDEISGFTYGSAKDSISLYWNNPSDLDFQKVEIYRSGVKIAETSASSYVDSHLPSGSSYTYVIKTVDMKGNVSNGTTYVARTKDAVPPASITNIVENHDHESIQISWHNPSDSDFHTVEVYRDGVFVGTTTDGTWKETGLAEGTAYQYEFVAVDTDGNKSPTSGVSVTTSDVTAPSEVSSITHTISDISIVLSWDNPSDSDFKEVQLKVNGVVVQDHLQGNSYTLTGLTPDTTYNITLSTRDESGNLSSGSNLVLHTVDSVPPSEIRNLVTSETHDSVTLSWNNPSDADFSHVTIYRNGVEIASVTGETYQDNSLNENTAYTYTIKSVDDAGNKSNGVSKTVQTKDITPPSEVSQLQYQQEKDGIHFSWNNPTDGDFQEVRIIRDGVEIARTTNHTFIDTAIEEKKTYTYRFLTVDTQQNVSSGKQIGVSTQDITMPHTIQHLVSNVTSSAATFSWENPSDDDFTAVEVFRDGIKQGEATNGTWRDTNVVEKATYTYTFLVKDSSGNLSDAVGITVTITDRTPPNEITNIQVLDEKKGITWTWHTPKDDDFDHVDIYKNGTKITSTKSNTFFDTNVKEKATYTYRFVTVDTEGNASSGVSQTIKVADKTPPSPLTGIQMQQQKGSVTLSWNAPVDDDSKQVDIYRNGVYITSETGTRYTDTNIQEKTQYTYRFVVVDTSGNRSSDTYYIGKTNDYTNPSDITNMSYTQGKGTLYFTFNMPKEDDVAGIFVYRDGVYIGKTTKGSFTDASVQEKKSYRYTFIAVDDSNNRSNGWKEQVYTKDMTNPNPVDKLVVSATEKGLIFSWNLDKADVAYTIIYKNGTEVYRTKDTTFTDNLSSNGTYQYEWMTVDEAGNTSERIPLTAEWRMKETIVPPVKEEEKPITIEKPKVEVPKTETPKVEEKKEEQPIPTPPLSVKEMEKVLETVIVKQTDKGVKIVWEKPKNKQVTLVVYRDGVKIGETTNSVFFDTTANASHTHEYKFVLLAGEKTADSKHRTIVYEGEKETKKEENKIMKDTANKKESSSRTWMIWGTLIIIIAGTIFVLRGKKDEE